jgi:hypothetical protein
MLRVDEKYKDKYLPNVESKNPYEKDEVYCLEMLQGFYGAYLRGGTGISFKDRAQIAINRSFGRGEHDTTNIKTFLTGGQRYPSSGVFSSFSQQNDKTLVELSKKAWNNIDWSPISPMPKIKAIVSKISDIDYEVSCDAIDPYSKDKEMDKKAYTMFMSKFGDWMQMFANNAGVPLDTPDMLPESDEEMDMMAAEDGFKAIYAMHQEILLEYSFRAGDYDEIRSQHVDDIFENGIIGMRIEKDPNSGRFYPVYVDIENSFIQSSKYSDFKDSEYAGEFESITISQMISYGASQQDVLGAMKYYSGWMGNISVPDNFEYADMTTRHNNMRVSVIRGAWIDSDIYRYKNYTNRFGRKRYVEQEGKDWGRVYDQANLKTTENRGRVLRQGCWVVGTDFVYGYGKVSNQPREDDRDVRLPYVFYKLRQKAMVEQCIPFINQLQIGWSKLQNAFIVAMNSGHAVNVSMLQNLTYGSDKLDWYDALGVMRGIGVLPFSQSFSGRYEGGSVSPITPIQGGVGAMLQECISMMEMSMNNIHSFTGLNPLQLGEGGDPNMPVRTSQMMMNATNDVLKPFIRASFKVKEEGAKVLNAMLATCVQDKEYMKRAYGGILSEASIITLGEAKKHGARYGLNLRVRPTDEEKRNLVEMAKIAMQAGLITPDINMYIKEKVLEGANIKRVRRWLSYKVEKERQRKHQEQLQVVKQQTDGNQQHEAMKQQTLQMENQMKYEGEAAMKDMQAKIDKEKEQERRLTVMMQEAMKMDEMKEIILNEARAYASKTEPSVQDAETPPTEGGESGIPSTPEVA